MKLKKIRIKNIRSYEDQEISFPNGSLLLSGDIGSGKTSILLAIEYALFGLQPGQKGSALLRNNAPVGEVNLQLEIDGQEIEIERRLKRESKSVSNDYSAITIDGEKRECAITELKTKILSLLHYPPEFIKKNNLLYRYTVYTPQEQMKQIISEDPEVRLNILGYVFGIDKYKRSRENLTILLNRLKEDSKVLQGEIKTLDDEKVRLEAKKILLLDLQSKIGKKQMELEENISQRKLIEGTILELEKKIKERETFEKEVEKTKIMVSSKKDNLLVLSHEHSALVRNLSEEGIEFSQDKLKEIDLKIKSSQKEFEDIVHKRTSLEREVSALNDKIKEGGNFEKEVDKTKTMIASKKDNLSVLDTELLSNLKVLSENKEIFSEEKLRSVISSLISKKEDIDRVNSRYIDILSRIRSLEQNKQEALERKDRVFQIERCLTCLQDVPHSHKHNILIKTENDIGEIKKTIASLEQEKNDTKILLDKLRFDLPKIEDEKTILESLRSKSAFIEKSKIRIEEIRRAKDTTEKDISSLYSQIEGLKEKITEFSKYDALFKSSSDGLEKIRRAEKALEINIAELKSMESLTKLKMLSAEKSKIRVEEIIKSKENLEKDVSLLTSHLDSLKESILEFSKFNTQFKLSSEELSKARYSEKSSEIALAEFKKEMEITNRDISLSEKNIEEKETSKKKLSSILELSDWLSAHFLGVINFMERNVMIKLRVEFARLFSKWFHTLAGESFDVHLDENFTPLIVQGEAEMDYSFLSGGERTAVALAYRLALNQTINSVLSDIKTKDIIILDEPTDGFSDLQLDKMRDVLTDLNVPQLIIVSHEQKIEGFVENVIRMKKEVNVSHQEDVKNQKT